MNACERVQQNIILAQYGELPDELKAGLEQHLVVCEECQREWNSMLALHEELALDPVVEVDANFLAASRMRLDEALDAIPARTFAQRFLSNAFRWQGWVKAAPALATLLVGVGFLGGTMLTRYQVAHQEQIPRAVIVQSSGQGMIASVSGIEQTPNSDLYTVKYNRIVPEQVQGSLDDPQIRQLLTLGTKLATTNQVHMQSVAMLSHECANGHACGSDDEQVRSTLLASLHYDKSPQVRLTALEGLKPYVAEDESVRDAVIEVLMHDSNAQVRNAAVGMLNPVNADTNVREALRTVSTRDANPGIRNASFQALQTNEDIQ